MRTTENLLEGRKTHTDEKTVKNKGEVSEKKNKQKRKVKKRKKGRGIKIRKNRNICYILRDKEKETLCSLQKIK